MCNILYRFSIIELKADQTLYVFPIAKDELICSYSITFYIQEITGCVHVYGFEIVFKTRGMEASELESIFFFLTLHGELNMTPNIYFIMVYNRNSIIIRRNHL